MQKILKKNFATKLQASSTKNKSTAKGKRYGVKKFPNERVYPLDVLITQKGFKYKPGLNTYFGRDQKIHASIEGIVKFTRTYVQKKSCLKKQTTIHVIPNQMNMRKDINPGIFNYHPEQYPELAPFNTEPYEFNYQKKINEKKQKIIPKKVEQDQLNFKVVNINIPEKCFQLEKQRQEEIENLQKIENLELYQNKNNERKDKIYSYLNSLDSQLIQLFNLF